jgi:hypothetical protein
MLYFVESFGLLQAKLVGSLQMPGGSAFRHQIAREEPQ